MKLYRIEINHAYNPKANLFGTFEYIPKLNLHTFQVHKETPCGYWFYDLNRKERWVSKNSRIAYAYCNIQDARRNFIKRTKKRKEINEYHLMMANKGLELIETFYKPKEKKKP